MKLALTLILALATTAAADSSRDKARAHFKQGKAFQDAGSYERAAQEYTLAYETDRRPEMLFNIAQAYRLAKVRERALFYFRQYLEKQPDGAGADEARRHVATLTKEIDEAKAAAQEPPATVLPPETTAAPPEVTAAPVERVVTEDHGKGLRISGIATGALGIVAIGVAVKFGFDARSAADDISSHTGPWTPGEQARFDDGERADRNMKITYVIGGALVAGGALLYYVGHRARETRVTTFVTPQGGGASVSGSF